MPESGDAAKDAAKVFSPVINYIGSKVRQLPLLDRVMTPHVPVGGVFGDLFAGTGTVAAHYRSVAGTVVANDHEVYSATLCRALLYCRFTPRVAGMIDELDELAGSVVAPGARGSRRRPGLVAANFSPLGPNGRMYFTPHNAARIDAVRERIEAWRCAGRVREPEHAFLLASLIRSCARVANTNGTYTAYLKRFWPRSERALRVLAAHTCAEGPAKRRHVVTCGDALAAARAHVFDAVYLDPPFNDRHYASYYGFYNFLIANDPTQALVGRTAAPAAYYRSPWGRADTARRSLSDLVTALRTRRLFLAYNSAGVLSKADICGELRRRGPTVLHVHKPRRVFRPHAGVLGAGEVEDWLFEVDCTGASRPPGAPLASFREVRVRPGWDLEPSSSPPRPRAVSGC
jgi:adenine-specific DNA-methyltransferase